MDNSREICISVAGARTAIYWQKQVFQWYEFVEKLKLPQRTAETIEQFLSMKKSDQDKLKDVGGFVGGELKDGRRKKGHVIIRDLITLDADIIPAGGTEDIV